MIPLFCIVKIGVPGTGHIIKWNGALYDTSVLCCKNWRTRHRSHHKVECCRTSQIYGNLIEPCVPCKRHYHTADHYFEAG